MQIIGKCLCGAIQFSCTPKCMDAHACHCGMCRRWTGGISLTIAVEKMPEILSQEGKDLLTTYKSSEFGERCFCSKCGTNLFSNSPSYDYYGVCAGALENEDQDKLSLDGEIFIDRKPAYYNLEGDRKKMTEAEFYAFIAGGSKESEEQ